MGMSLALKYVCEYTAAVFQKSVRNERSKQAKDMFIGFASMHPR